MTHAPHLLLVEDNPGDVDMVRDAIHERAPHVGVTAVHDGPDAVAYLSRTSPYERAIRPDLVLLDLNLPRLGGLEVLRWIRQDPGVRHLPVIVLTSSEASGDILDSYRLGANCYLAKPLDLQSFERAMDMVTRFWLELVRLP
ncbi:MAG: response regulator [Vicinamibacterales bacterium]